MIEPNFMSWDVFDRDSEQIETAVTLLLADPKRRKRFHLGTVYEKRTDERLADVLSTSFGPVVIYSAQVGTMPHWKPRASGEGVPLHLRQNRSDVQPPPELADGPCGPMPFYPGRDSHDPVVVAAVREFHARIGRWCAARPEWSGEHGWPGGNGVRIAQEREVVEEYVLGYDPTAI